MGVQVQFDYAAWAAAFPMFSHLSVQQITGPVLTFAQQYCRNDGGGPVTDAGLQLQLLNLMVAHVAQILYGTNQAAGPSAVGRLSSATEGSVSASFEFPTSADQAWFAQTQWGAMYWQMIAPFRLGAYVPKVTPLWQPLARPWPGLYQ